MLNLLENVLKINGFYIKEELKTIYSTPCTGSNIFVLNFDKIKEKFCKQFGIKNLTKSCDLLVINKEKNELFLIEMKRTASQKAAEFITTYRNSSEFRDKYIHSIFLLLAMISHFNIDEKFYSFFLCKTNKPQLKIRTIVICDLPKSEMAYMYLSTINSTGISFPKIMAGEIEIINCDQFNKYFKAA